MPVQHDTVIRRVGSVAYGLYASTAYLDRLGMPNFQDDALGHDVIHQQNDVEGIQQFVWLEAVTHRAKIVLQTSSHEASVSAALEGCGLACLARFRADRENGLVSLSPPTPPPSSEIWLAVHKDNRDTARIRAVMNHVIEHIRLMRDALMPDGSIEPDYRPGGPE